MTDTTTKPEETRKNHTLWEDAQGIVFGASMAAFGVTLLTSMGLVTGQTAGLAVLISYVTGWSFGAVFFVVNLPFYWFGYRRLGLRFTIKTFLAVALLSVLSKFLPTQLEIVQFTPWVGAILVGMITGAGLLALFRHGSSLGGIGILGLYLQEKTGFRAGYLQLGVDLCIFVAALFIMPFQLVVWSLLGAVVLNFVIAINHRRDWYVVT